jgi:CRISPR-associated endonuclease/helicase Cas3
LFYSFVRGAIPPNLNLPTGSGKTNAIVCWLLALCENPELPRRLADVVDRRSVVDQSTKVVEDIASKLNQDSATIASVRSALVKMAGGEELLGVSTLRGEFQDNQEWSKFPFRPAVVCGTVDMVGSRLLFSGYGDGAYSRSLHAGLLGNDTLVIFDECHLVPEFGNLLHLVHEAGGKLKPFHYMLMSATSTDEGEIQISDSDLKSETLGKRLRADKTLHLVHTDKPVIAEITTLAQTDPPQRTVVFVRSPTDAAKIATSLRKHHRNVVTLTGTMRGKERDELVENPVFAAFTVEQEPSEPHFLVATSAGEVGIDLTCAHMITDIASVGSLVQRFGRCNRFGETEGEIYLVYNSGRLSEQQKSELAFLKDDLNGNVSCLSLWNNREKLSTFAPEIIAIQSLPANVLDVLSMTSLRHDMDVSLYLLGRNEESQFVEIAWRKEATLLADMRDADFESYMKPMRVLSYEKLSETVKRTREVVDEIISKQGDATVVVIQPDGTKSELATRLSQLHVVNLRNCLIILPPDRGGLSGGMFAVENADNAELDIAELPHKHHKARLRYIEPVGEEVAIDRGWKVAIEGEVNGMLICVLKEKAGPNGSTVLLRDHSQAVADTARKFAESSGLDAESVEALVCAARHHDDGKANPIWQLHWCA